MPPEKPIIELSDEEIEDEELWSQLSDDEYDDWYERNNPAQNCCENARPDHLTSLGASGILVPSRSN